LDEALKKAALNITHTRRKIFGLDGLDKEWLIKMV